MPLVSPEQASNLPNLQLTRPEDQPTMPPDVDSPGFVDMASAVFRQFPNTGLMAINELTRLRGAVDDVEVESMFSGLNPKPAPVQGYNPFADPQLEGAPPEWFDRLIRVDSPEEMTQKLRKLRQEQSDRDTIARSGWPGVALTLSTALTDPLTLLSVAVPVAAPEAWGTRAERIGAAVAATAYTSVASSSSNGFPRIGTPSTSTTSVVRIAKFSNVMPI